tara:strand:- start:8128 stop:8433 length:306 start_codon:yes stop_codon:yes gene_type:complete
VFGPAFESEAALGTFYAMPAIAACAIGYMAAACRNADWLLSMLACQGSYLAVMAVLLPFAPSEWLTLLFCAAALGAGLAATGLPGTGFRWKPGTGSISRRS